jgi:hypothetical protein
MNPTRNEDLYGVARPTNLNPAIVAQLEAVYLHGPKRQPRPRIIGGRAPFLQLELGRGCGGGHRVCRSPRG